MAERINMQADMLQSTLFHWKFAKYLESKEIKREKNRPIIHQIIRFLQVLGTSEDNGITNIKILNKFI